MKRQYSIIPIVALALAAGFTTGFAAEEVDLTTVEDLTTVTIPSEFSVWGGYYLVDGDTDPLPDEAAAAGVGTGRNGSPKAAEYRSLNNSLSGGFHYESIQLPHRIHAEADIRNGEDWLGDFRYSNLDIFQFRFMPRRVYHNLDNLEVFDFDPTINAGDATGLGVFFDVTDIERLDKGTEYGITTDMNKYFLRLKPRDYPLHVYGHGEQVIRKGSQQLRFLGNSGYFNDRTRTTQARDIDMETREYTIGSSVHLGYFEVDLSHTDRSYGADTDNPMYYAYTAGGGRPAGTYAHHLYPDLKASTNTLNIHTDHTGRLYGSATLSRIKKENEYSGVEAENLLGYAEVFWLPITQLAFSGHFRHQENKEDTPATVESPGIGAVNVDPGMDYRVNIASAHCRYAPIPKLTLNGKYSRYWKTYEDETASIWSRPAEIIRDTYDLSANWRLLPALTVNGRLVQEETRLNEGLGTFKHIDPEHSTQGILSASWMPNNWMMALFRADVTREDSNNIKLLDANYDFVSEVNERNVTMQNFLTSVTFMVSESFNLTGSYTLSKQEIEQDMHHDETATTELIDENFSIEQWYHSIILEAAYKPTKRITLNGSIDYIKGKGDYTPTAEYWLVNIDIGEISRTRVTEISYRLEGDYYLGAGWTTGLDIQVTDWEDKSFDNPSEGLYLSTLMKVSKKF